MTSGATRRRLAAPDDFDFEATVTSHGWVVLEPFRMDEERTAIERPLRVPGGVAVVEVTQPGGRGEPVEVRIVAGRGSRGGLDDPGWRTVERAVVRMLGLGVDLAPFHARCREAGPPFDRAPGTGFGRLLRSPTVFEDLVKILATTNTSWAGTKGMVARLVALCGGPGGAFPTPRDVARVGAGELRGDARWGYRAEPLAHLAHAVAAGRLDLGRWERWEGTSEDLEREVLGLRGFGPYAAAHALALMGRHDRIGVDTVFREFVAARHFPDAAEPPPDRRMLEIYDGWGEWKGLAYWYELWSEYRARDEVPEE